MITLSRRAMGSLVRLGIVAIAWPLAAFAQDPTHPLGNTTIEAIIGRLIGGVLGILGVISLVMFIWSGFTWMVAGGNAEKVKLAKRNITYAISGLIVCFTSFAVLRWVLGTLIPTAVSG